MEGAQLTAVVDALLFLEASDSPLEAGQRREAVEVVSVFLADCDRSEEVTARVDGILTPSQRTRLKSYPGGTAAELGPSPPLAARILARLAAYRPPTAPPGRVGGQVGSASGDLPPTRMIRVLEGLAQLLEDPACDLTLSQARGLERALEGIVPLLERARATDERMRALFTPEQLGRLPAGMGGAEHDRSILRALEAWLAAGAPPPRSGRWRPPGRRRPTSWSLLSLGTGLVALEQAGSAGLEPVQRARLLAEVRLRLASLDALVEATRRCLGTLTPDQWRAIYASPIEEAFQERYGIRHPQEALEALIEAYAARAAAGPAPGAAIDPARFDPDTPPFIRMVEGLLHLERAGAAPLRPTALQARQLHDELVGMRAHAARYAALAELFSLLTAEQLTYLREADVELDHEHNYVATLLTMLVLDR